MKNKGTGNTNTDGYEVTQHDANKAKSRQVVVDPEKGPENKKRKNRSK